VELEAIVPLEPIAAATATAAVDGRPRDYSLVDSSTGRAVGTVAVRLEAAQRAPDGTARHVAADPHAAVDALAAQGLVSLVGLAPPAGQGVRPFLDFDPVDPATVADPNAQRQLHQLQTLGPFVTPEYLQRHIATMREPEARRVAERALAYHQALAADSTACCREDVPSPKAFRPSSSRSTVVLSGLGFNVHTSSVAVAVTEQAPAQSPQHRDPAAEALYNTTCGAPADHARDFGSVFPASSGGAGPQLSSPVGGVSGGLRRLEIKRQELAGAVTQAQAELVSTVAQYFGERRQNKASLSAPTHVPANYPGIEPLRARLRESVHALHHVTWICATRRANVFSQALGIAATTYLGSLSDPARTNSMSPWPDVWKQYGYLLSFEGMLSAAGKELGMIEDAFVGIAMLRMVRVVLVRDDGLPLARSQTLVPASPYVRWIDLKTSGEHATRQFVLQIGLVASYYDQRIPAALRGNAPVQLYPLLFQVGVDIRQWGANAGTSVLSLLEEQKNTLFTAGSDRNPFETESANQAEPNAAAVAGGIIDDEDDDVGATDLDVLVQLNWTGFRLLNVYAGSVWSQQARSTESKVHPRLEKLYQHILGSAGKMNHNILVEAAAICRQLGGGAAVFCKSGKDRTAMHITYKQAEFIREYRQRHAAGAGAADTLPPPVESTIEIATLMRTHGTRLPICEKNVGQALYAFNSLQVKFMPESLKPPMNTLAGFLKGGKIFEGGGIES
jgi:hypothetical protein